jgi:hypothetical protein
MNAFLKAKIVNVAVERGESGAYFATSPDMKGLQVAAMSLDEMRLEIPRAIKMMYAACGEDVLVTPVEEDDGEIDRQWVAIPAVIAKTSRASV